MAEADQDNRQKGDWLNWSVMTLVYTFLLGAVTGSIFAIASGSVADDGKLLTIYLSVLGALFAAALGWFGNRAADTLVDRRQRRRKTNVALMRIRFLAYHLNELSKFLAPFIADPRRPQPRNFTGVFSARAASVGLAAAALPEFDSLLENDADISEVVNVTNTFLTIQAAFPAELEAAKLGELWENLIHPKGNEGLKMQFNVLHQANAYFSRHQAN